MLGFRSSLADSASLGAAAGTFRWMISAGGISSTIGLLAATLNFGIAFSATMTPRVLCDNLDTFSTASEEFSTLTGDGIGGGWLGAVGAVTTGGLRPWPEPGVTWAVMRIGLRGSADAAPIAAICSLEK